MYEIYTIGGGRFLNQFFNAVAAITQSSQFQYAILTAMLIAAAWIMLELSFNVQNWQKPRVWLAGAVVIVGTMTGTTATVGITDRINTSGNIYIVDNVPFGLALFASFTSTIGDEITRLTETAFSSTNSPSLRDHGFLFGVRLLEKSTRAEIKNDDFSRSISGFIRNCTFYDIMLGLKSLDELKVAEDPWVYITSNPVKSRMFELRSPPAATNIVTCFDGVGPLNAMWAPEIVDAGTRLVASVSPGSDLNQAALRGIIYNNLGDFHEYLIGASTAATDILKRQMTINAIFREPAAWNSDVGNAAALEYYISARLDLQTRQSYGAIGRQAEKWVPNLKAVFQSLYYGVFPIAVLLMLSPIGMTVLKNYIFGLIWIESWGPLYAILNYLMTAQAKEQMQAWVKIADPAAGNIQLAAQAGIQAVEADISIMAGYLSMSVPFIAIALVSGAGKFAHLATSTLSVTQEAVGDTTRESATGNLSIGNTGYANHSFNQTNGFGHNTNPFHQSMPGHSSSTTTEGGVETETSNQTPVYNAGGGQSSGPTTPNLSGMISNTVSDSISNAKNLEQSQNRSLGATRQKMEGHSTSLADNIVRGETDTLSYNQGESTTTAQDFSTLRNAGTDFTENKSYDEREVLQAAFSLSAAAGLPKGKGILTGDVSAQERYEKANTTSVSYGDAVKFSEQQSVKEALGRVTSASSTESASWSDGENTSFSDAQTASYQKIDTLSQNRGETLSNIERLEEQKSQVESDSASINQSLGQPYYEYVIKQFDGDTNAANALLSSADKSDIRLREEYADDFLRDFYPEYFEEPVKPDLDGEFNSQDNSIVPTVLAHSNPVDGMKSQLPSPGTRNSGEVRGEVQQEIANTGEVISQADQLVDEYGGDFKKETTKQVDTNLPEKASDVITGAAVGFGAAKYHVVEDIVLGAVSLAQDLDAALSPGNKTGENTAPNEEHQDSQNGNNVETLDPTEGAAKVRDNPSDTSRSNPRNWPSNWPKGQRQTNWND